MNAANKWTLFGGTLALALVVLFPPWRQFYHGHPLVYKEQMGRHLIWKPPAAVGEQSWIIQASPAECQVKIKLETMLRNCGTVFAMTIALFLAFRLPTGNTDLAASLTHRKTAIVSLLLALCLPVPEMDGMPLAALVVMAPISLFSDSGHVGPWAVPVIAGTVLAVYFTPIFLVISAMAWLVRWRASFLLRRQ
jgi:hypothetical protein